MNKFFSGFADELVKTAEGPQRESALKPATVLGGTLGSLIGLLSSAKGKRLARTLKGGGIGALSGIGAGSISDMLPHGDITLQADRETLERLLPKGGENFSPREWGKVWI